MQREDVERFDLGTVHLCGQQPRGSMKRHAEGEFVRYDHYAALLDRAERAEAERGAAIAAAVQGARDAILAWRDNMKREHPGNGLAYAYFTNCARSISPDTGALDRLIEERLEAERDAAFAAGQASVLDNLPDEVDLFRAIRDSGAKKRIDIARAVIRALPIKEKHE